MRHLALAAALAIGLTACSPSAGDAGAPAAPTTSSFRLASPDFTEGGEIPAWATASAFGGQCAGDNLNPALEWAGAPDSTQAYALVMLDRSAKDFVHWVHIDIPGDVTGVARGASGSLAGADGANDGPTPGYFGPCPPGPDHRYEFMVYALDAPLGFANDAGYGPVMDAIRAHALAQASIVGVRSGPANASDQAGHG